MNCCETALDRQFSPKKAQADLDRYLRDGPDATTRAILALVSALDLEGATLLDIGSGIGVLHHELLSNGSVRTATAIEPSQAYVDVARAEAERRGLTSRTVLKKGEFQDVADDVWPADLVTLDRVLCCDPDLETLVSGVATKSKRYVAASYPNDQWYIKLIWWLGNVSRALIRNPFRAFVHPVARIDATFAAAAFRRIRTIKSFVWQIALYEGGEQLEEES
jgi:magnesium-protoporphyrin O-methyltransferase